MVNFIQAIFSYVIVATLVVLPVRAEEPSPTSSPDSTETQSNQDLIDYLERQKQEEQEKQRQEQEKKLVEEQEKKEKEEQEKKEKEEKEELEKQENLDRASFDSSSDVIYGYANKYAYYFVGYTRANNYSNYTYYGYYFTQYTRFERVGNIVKFSNGKGKYVYCTNGGCTTSELTNSFTIPSWHNIQSNIYEVDYPSITSIDKTYVHLIDYASEIISALLAIVVLWFISDKLIFNKGKRRS
jgi:hypothetical protein